MNVPLRNDLAAGLLAAAVHGFFVLLLVFGLSWQIRQTPQPVMAELWTSLPQPSPAEPRPAPAKAPAPVPKPVAVPAPEPKADIALERKRQEDRRKQQAALDLQKKREAEKLREQKQAEEREQQRREDSRRKDLALEREAAQREEEAMRRRLLEESLASETAQLKAKAAADLHAAEVAKLVARYRDLIGAKVRGNTRLPEGLAGNPEVEFRLSVLPTGEIARITLSKSSGNSAYDQAVQRGIEKSSPLPLPADRAAAAEFRDLLLRHRAHE